MCRAGADDALARIESAVTASFSGEGTGHDLDHLRRVAATALALAAEEGADPLVAGAASLLHDIHRLMEGEDGRYHPPEESLPRARAILEGAGFPREMVDAVLHCVARHEDRPFASDGAREPASLEARVVQDADNLDAMGAIGVARCFAYGGAHGRALGRPDDRGREGPYDPAAGGGSAVAHFHEKLLRLRGAMGTRAGRRRAAGRHAYMVRFLARYGREWAGEA